MTNSKSTKRTLISGALAILMCTAMLIGTTFAWFTDTASTAVNKIQAGNLDIDVEYTLDGEEWAPLDEATDLFGDGLFEPGYTRVVAFRIFNKGSLALKYNMSMNLVSETKGVNKAGEEFALSDYLMVKTSPIQEVNQIGDIMVGIAFDRTYAGAIAWNPETGFKDTQVLTNDHALTAGQQVYFIMQVYMPTTVGNEANALDPEKTPSIKFGINFMATQATVEKDSYDNKYDKDATYPIADIGGLKDAITKNGTYNVIEDITTDEQLLVKNAVVTIDATGKTINNTEDIWADGKAYALISASGSATDLTIAGGSFIAKENDCFTIDIWDGASVTIKDGTFSGNSSCVYVGEGTLTIEGGTFFIKQLSPNTNDYRYLLNCLDGNYKNGTAKIIVKGGTFVNFDPSDNAAEGEGTSFVADGYKVISEVHGSDTWYTVIAE